MNSPGTLAVVGLGPGNPGEITPRALAAIRESTVVVGYTLYIRQIEAFLEGKTVARTAMRGEVERCRLAVGYALDGERVCMVSGGDPGVYGMAGLVHQLAAPYPQLQVEVIPGITAATAAAAVLGAPLGHDFSVISLSDLLTPWELIERRLRLASEGDFVICIYNPASKKRADYLHRACGILLERLAPETPCGMVRNAGRDGETHMVLTLEQLAALTADMFTTVIIGNSQTQVQGGRLVTPRGYVL